MHNFPWTEAITPGPPAPQLTTPHRMSMLVRSGASAFGGGAAPRTIARAGLPRSPLPGVHHLSVRLTDHKLADHPGGPVGVAEHAAPFHLYEPVVKSGADPLRGLVPNPSLH